MNDNDRDAHVLTERIGQRLEVERMRRDWSLIELSEQTGRTLGKSRLCNYEQGIRRPSIAIAVQLAEVFGNVSPTWLLCLNDSDPLSEAENRLGALYRATDARGRETLLTLACAVSEASASPNSDRAAQSVAPSARSPT
jgi:transcriptional regulator with XRE-family HTH domain